MYAGRWLLYARICVDCHGGATPPPAPRARRRRRLERRLCTYVASSRRKLSILLRAGSPAACDLALGSRRCWHVRRCAASRLWAFCACAPSPAGASLIPLAEVFFPQPRHDRRSRAGGVGAAGAGERGGRGGARVPVAPQWAHADGGGARRRRQQSRVAVWRAVRAGRGRVGGPAARRRRRWRRRPVG
jgi:hypothetical protein